MKSDLFYMDCMVGCKGYTANQFDIGWFDTQYGIGEDGRKSASRAGKVKQKSGSELTIANNHQSAGWDSEVMPVEYWLLMREITKNQFIFGVNYIHRNIPYITYDWTDKPPRRHEYAEFIERNPVGFIIWDKCNGDSDFSDCELIWTSYGKPSFVKHYMWSGFMQAADAVDGTRQQGNKKLNQKRIHPTEKPIPLIRWFLVHHCGKVYRLLDTHSGSQSARVACYYLDIEYTGYETYEPYVLAGNKRYELITQQQTLFRA